jgi:hypothetical protein
MSSSMRFAMMAAAGSRARDTGIWRDFGARIIARLAGFPTIFPRFRRQRPGRPGSQQHNKQATVFNLEDKTADRIVNNIECGYHLKKR